MGKIFLNTLAAVQIDNQIWFSAWNINGLFKLDIISKDIEFVHRFQNLAANAKCAHRGNVIYDKGEMFFFPFFSKKIVIYNIFTKVELEIDIPDCKSEIFAAVGAIQVNRKIVFWGDESLYFYELDMETRAIKVLPYEEWVLEKLNQKCSRKEWCKDRFIITFDDWNYFIEIRNGSAELKKYPSNVKCGKRPYFLKDRNGYWLCMRDTWTVFYWEENQIIADEYEIDEDTVNCLGTYEDFFVISPDIYLLARANNRIYKVNKEKKMMEVCYDYSNLINIIHMGLGEVTPFLITFCIDENVVFFPRGADKLLFYNLENKNAKVFPFSIDARKMFGENGWGVEEDIPVEGDVDLTFYLEMLKKGEREQRN